MFQAVNTARRCFLSLIAVLKPGCQFFELHCKRQNYVACLRPLKVYADFLAQRDRGE